MALKTTIIQDFTDFIRNSEMTMTTGQNHKTWMCLICGFIYDEAAGLPNEGIPPGTRREDVPKNWV